MQTATFRSRRKKNEAKGSTLSYAIFLEGRDAHPGLLHVPKSARDDRPWGKSVSLRLWSDTRTCDRVAAHVD
jgi:hypothetical protein